MAFVSKDRVKETSTTTGTGDFTLAGAQTGFKAFSAVCSSGDTFFYTIVNNVSGEFEIGEGTFTAGGALQRDTVLSSSNSNSAVTFGAGSKDVFLTAASDALIQASTDGTLTISEGTTFSADVSLGGDVLWDASDNALEFNDNIKAVFGTDGDLFITHTGVVGRLVSENGNIQIQAQEANSDVVIQADDQAGSTSEYFRADGSSGSAQLFFAASGSSSVKLATTNTGADITGVLTTDGITTSADINFGDNDKAVFGTGSDFEIYHDGSDTYFNQAGTGELRFGTSGSFDMQYFDGAAFRLTDNFELQFGSGNDFDMDYDSSLTAMVFNDNQTTKDFRFQQAGTDKIVFSSDNWEFQDGVKASFGTGSDLSIEHDGTNSLIANTTGDLNIQTSGSLVYQLNQDDAVKGPNLKLYRNSASPTNVDILGSLEFHGNNAAAEEVRYAYARARIRDTTDGAEDGALQFFCMRDGVDTQILKYDNDEGPDEVVINGSSFDIDFRVESDNKTHALFVDGANGVIGMGDSAPQDRLSRTTSGAVGRSTTGFEYVASRNDTTVGVDNFIGGYLFQTNDSGGTTKWGGMSAKGDDTSGNGVLEFFPVTNTYETSGNEGLMQLADTADLFLRAGGMRINRSEKNVYRAAEESLTINHAGAGANDTYTQVVVRDGTGGDHVWRHQRRGVVKSEIEENGDYQSATNSYGGTSDQRLKENIVASGSQWDDIKALQIKKYSMIEDGLDAPNMLGVIAQDLQASGMNGLVKQHFKTDDEDNPILDADGNQEEYLSVKYSVMYMKAIKALQEAMAKIETLEAENISIKARLDALEAG